MKLLAFTTNLFIALNIFLFSRAYIDDTYITLAYVENLYENFQWGIYKDIPANSSTSPLNVILLCLFRVFLRDSELSVLVLSIFFLLGSFYVLQLISQKLGDLKFFPLVSLVLLFLNPFIFSSIGLEAFGVIFLFTLVVFYSLSKNELGFGLTTGFLYFLRPDAVVLVLPFLVSYFLNWKKFLKIIFLSILVNLPVTLYRIYFFHSIFPDTLIIKKSQLNWGEYSFFNGILLYLNKYPLETNLSLFPVFISLLLLIYVIWKNNLKNSQLVIFLFLSGSLHFFSYSKLKVPPYHWYYAPTFIPIILGFCVLLDLLFAKVSKNKKVYSLFFLILLHSFIFGIQTKYKEMPVHTNWAKRDDYKLLAESLDRDFSFKVYSLSFGEVGTLAYFSKNVILLDYFTHRNEIIRLCLDFHKKKPKLDFLNSVVIHLSCLKHSFHEEKLKDFPVTKVFKKSNEAKAHTYGPLESRWHEKWWLEVSEKN